MYPSEIEEAIKIFAERKLEVEHWKDNKFKVLNTQITIRDLVSSWREGCIDLGIKDSDLNLGLAANGMDKDDFMYINFREEGEDN